MNANILCTLLAQRIPPINGVAQFQVRSSEVVFFDPDEGVNKPIGSPHESPYDTPENRAIVADVIANYDTLAKEYEASQAILLQIIALEALQTPRRLREAVSDPSWMNDLDSQIAELRNKL